MALTLIEQVRLTVGDYSEDMQILPDETYQWFLDKNENNVNRSALEAARCILMELTKIPTRERTGNIEVWNEWANAYRKALLEMIRNPALFLSVPVPYAGGISKSDMRTNDANNDNVRPVIYRGIQDGIRPWNQHNKIHNDTIPDGDFLYDEI